MILAGNGQCRPLRAAVSRARSNREGHRADGREAKQPWRDDPVQAEREHTDGGGHHGTEPLAPGCPPVRPHLARGKHQAAACQLRMTGGRPPVGQPANVTRLPGARHGQACARCRSARGAGQRGGPVSAGGRAARGAGQRGVPVSGGVRGQRGVPGAVRGVPGSAGCRAVRGAGQYRGRGSTGGGAVPGAGQYRARGSSGCRSAPGVGQRRALSLSRTRSGRR